MKLITYTCTPARKHNGCHKLDQTISCFLSCHMTTLSVASSSGFLLMDAFYRLPIAILPRTCFLSRHFLAYAAVDNTAEMTDSAEMEWKGTAGETKTAGTEPTVMQVVISVTNSFLMLSSLSFLSYTSAVSDLVCEAIIHFHLVVFTFLPQQRMSYSFYYDIVCYWLMKEILISVLW